MIYRNSSKKIHWKFERSKQKFLFVQVCAPHYKYFFSKFEVVEPVGTCFYATNGFETIEEYASCRQERKLKQKKNESFHKKKSHYLFISVYFNLIVHIKFWWDVSKEFLNFILTWILYKKKLEFLSDIRWHFEILSINLA